MGVMAQLGLGTLAAFGWSGLVPGMGGAFVGEIARWVSKIQ